MPENIFHFKQFVIKQDKCAMKVGTDGMLLGAWVDAANTNRILDIGTGTAMLALMLAQKSGAEIDAVEIDFNAYQQAEENVKTSKWHDRINVVHSSIQQFSQLTKHKYELIISNPPFFKTPNTGKGNNKQNTFSAERAGARFTELLSHQDLIESVKLVLNPEGKFILILPSDESKSFIKTALKSGLYVHSSLQIKSKPHLPEIRQITEFGFKENEITEKQFVIYNPDGSYTEEYIALTKNYHAKDL